MGSKKKLRLRENCPAPNILIVYNIRCKNISSFEYHFFGRIFSFRFLWFITMILRILKICPVNPAGFLFIISGPGLSLNFRNFLFSKQINHFPRFLLENVHFWQYSGSRLMWSFFRPKETDYNIRIITISEPTFHLNYSYKVFQDLVKMIT